MPQRSPDPRRRSILRGTRDATAATLAVAVLGPVGTTAAAPQQPAAASGPPPDRGYHETEHTRRYYQLARF
jgi:hypothetical protein